MPSKGEHGNRSRVRDSCECQIMLQFDPSIERQISVLFGKSQSSLLIRCALTPTEWGNNGQNPIYWLRMIKGCLVTYKGYQAIKVKKT